MAKLIDPDSLNQGTEVVINTSAKTIQLLVAGNLDDTSPGKTSGVAEQVVYSFLKEEWKSDASLNKFKFPMKAIFEAKFEMVNGWEWADQQTIDLLRDGGFRYTTDDQEYACIISLGDVEGSGNQPYYQQVSGYDQPTTNFDKTDELNENIQIWDGGAGDYRGFLKVFLREQGKLYDQGNLVVDQDLSALTYQAYRLPLSNQSDIKISATDITIDTTTPYVATADFSFSDGSVTSGSTALNSASATFIAGDVGKLITVASGSNAGRFEIVTFNNASNVNVDRNFGSTTNSLTYVKRDKGITITFLKGERFSTWGAGAKVAGHVVQNGSGRWYFSPGGGTSSGDDSDLLGGSDTGISDWERYDGEEQIGANYYAFNVVIEGNSATIEEIYEFAQKRLRDPGAGGPADINDDVTISSGSQVAYGTVQGKVSKLFCAFQGDTLQTRGGVLVRSFDINDKNDIQLFSIDVVSNGSDGLDSEDNPLSSTSRSFPFVAAGNIVFSSNLDAEPNADTLYRMYFEYIRRLSGNDLGIASSSGSTAAITSSATDLSVLNDNDWLIVSGFSTGSNNGLWQITGTPVTNSASATKRNGIDPQNESAGASVQIDQNPFDSAGAVVVEDNDGSAIQGEITAPSIAFDFDYDFNNQGSRIVATQAPVVIVAQGLSGAEWISGNFTITRTTGLSFPVNAADERNYSNP